MRRCLLGLVLLGLSACEPPRVDGTVDSSSDVFGEWTLALSDCANGSVSGFFGVDLWDDTVEGVAVRVLDEPLLGSTVVVLREGASGSTIEPALCARYRIDLDLQRDADVRGVRFVRGSIDLVCDDGAGGVIAGAATFKNCRGEAYQRPPSGVVVAGE